MRRIPATATSRVASHVEEPAAPAPALPRRSLLETRPCRVAHLRCQLRQQMADTKRTHQKRHARRLATHLYRLQQPDLQEKLCRDGKEGVDGSSPSEGFGFLPAQASVLLSALAADSHLGVHSTSTSVHGSQ